MADSEHYLGVDFGTSNSYCCLTAKGYLSANPVFINGKASISSSLLREKLEDGTEKIRAFGDKAEEEWGLASKKEKGNMSLRTMFKPDISHSEQARTDAGCFLTQMAEYLKEQVVLPGGKSPHQLNVLIGSPANVYPDHEKILVRIAEESGFGDIKIVKEPVGALIHHVAAKHDVSTVHTRQGVLVVDFGGGTCDIAYMLRLEIMSAWGDPMLGGRLFDDLFYQWFIESNPGVEKTIREDDNEYYVHWVLCRELKERFSQTMSRDRNSKFTYHVHVGDKYYGAIKDAVWDEFLHRSSHYTPGKSVRDLLPGLKDRCPQLASKSVDLIEWFRSIVYQGLKSGKVHSENIHWIILTGGSSSWPFVKDIVSQIFEIKSNRILASPNPQSAVGEGIALLPVIQDLHRASKSTIQTEQEEKIYEIHTQVNAIVDRFIESATSELTGLVVDKEVFPILQEFSRTGGQIKKLKKKIDDRLLVISPEFEKILSQRAKEVESAINQKVIDILYKWFRENGIRHWEPATRYLDSLAIEHPQANAIRVDDPLYKSFAIISALVTSTLSSAVLGGGGTALLFSGPQGLAAGFFIGLLISTSGLLLGEKKLRGWTESLRVPKFLASMLFTENKLERIVSKSKDKIRHDLRTAIITAYREQTEILEKRISELVMEQIDSLTALDHL